MARLCDISKATNLGLGTVSDILRHKPGYNDQTRRRVLEAAQKLNYRPNLNGQALQRGRTQSIGLLAGSLNVPVASFKLHGIVKAAREADFACYVGQLGFDEQAVASKVVDGMLGRGVDGLIVYLGSPLEESALKALQSQSIPIVYLDWAPPEARHRILVNRMAGIRQMARYLGELGHRRVRYIVTSSDVYDPSLKLEAYRQVLRQENIELERPWDLVLDPDKPVAASAYELVQELIRAGQLPTALLMSNDEAALGATAALRDAGLNVPGDVTVVGFDDVPHAAYCRPALTTIHQPRGEAGRAAFGMLLALMQDQPLEQKHVELDCSLIKRQSSGPARGHRIAASIS
jgi:LacI family transcriptional regulator